MKNISSVNNRSDDTVFTLLESLPEEAFLMDTKGTIINSNSLFAAHYGKRPQECIGVNIYDLIVTVLKKPEMAAHRKEKVEEVLRTGIRTFFDDYRDNHLRRFTINPVRSPEGDIIRLFVTLQDVSEQQCLEDQLKHQMSRFNFALEAAHAGVWEWSLKTNELIWSKEIWSLHGLERSNEKPTFKLWASTVHPDDREMVIQAVTTAAGNNTELRVEYRVFFTDGSVHWLMSRGKLLFDNNGLSTHYIGTIFDITEHKIIELDLNESKMRYSYALDASRSGIWEWDVKTDTLSWSEQVWELYGLKVNALPLNNQLCVDTIHPDDREMASWLIRDAVSKGAAASLEYRTCHPDGSVHWLTSRGMPLHNAKGQVTRYIGAIIDITERKQIETELIESKERLTFALEATNTGVWEWDVAEDRVTWTDNVWKLYGLEKNSLPHTHRLCESNIHPDDRDFLFEKVMVAANKEVEILIEYRVCHKDGSIHWLRCQGLPKFNTDGRLKCYSGTVTDITTRRELLNELVDNKTMLSQALEAARAGVWEWNMKTGKNVWSDETWLLYGIEKGDRTPSFELWTKTIHPDDRDMAIEVVASAADNETELYVEYRIFYADGTVHWLMSRGKPFYDMTGKVERYVGTIIDITKQKETEEQYRRNKERLDFVLENSHVGVWDLNLQDSVTTRTLEHAHIFGYETIPPVWSLETFFNHVIPDDRARIQALVRSSIETQEKYSFECQIHAANGELRWIWVACAFKSGIDSESNHIVGVVRDIIARKIAEQQMIDGKATLNAALESMNDAVFISDVEGNFIEFNTAFATFHRFKDKQECLQSLSGYPAILDVFMSDGKLAPLEQWAVSRALRGENVTNAEYTLCRKDTGETWVGSYNFAPILDNKGKIIGSVVTGRDVTQQKQAQTILRESELKFKTIFENSPVGIAIRGVQDGIVFDVNVSWERIFGYTKEEVVGRKIKDLGLYLQNKEYESNVTAINEQGKILNKPMQFRNKSGGIIHVLYFAQFITLNDKACILVMITDITVQALQQVNIEQLELIVADRTGQLKDEVKRLNSFLHMISHEYRTPLAIIRGNLDLIELKNKPRNCLNPVEMTKIRRAIDRLVEVMEESMHESRFLESKTILPFQPFQLASVITSQVDSFMAMWPDQTIECSSNLEGSEILGDTAQLKLAIFNLFDNARKFSPSGSTIELEYWKEGDEAVIRIRNQGMLTSEGEAEEIFEKFKRGRNSMNTGGAGLGLWMVKSIIEKHKGEISLKGIASGVEATIRLPLFHKSA